MQSMLTNSNMAGRQMMGPSMTAGMDNPALLWPPRLYWIVVGSVIAAFTCVNLINQAICRQRLNAVANDGLLPAKPKNILLRIYATLTAVTRELSNSSIPSFTAKRLSFIQPTVGKLAMLVFHVIVAVTLCLYYRFSTTHGLPLQNIAYSCGFVSIAQLPLIFLLAGKNNIIGFLVGSSYERLNWLHRWVARTLLVTTTMHMGYWFVEWAPYNVIGHNFKTDFSTQTGFSAWCILLWIVFSSFAPIRGWSYEIFILQHTISYIAFVTVLFLHTPIQVHDWLWAPVAIYLFDRLTRALYTGYLNISFFHPGQNARGDFAGVWTCRAAFSSLPCQVTRVTISNPPLTWKPGQHAFFSCHTVAALQSHPFTISSLPEDGKLEFYIKAQNGGTKRLFNYADNCSGLPRNSNIASSTVPVILDGPYGRMRPLHQFDSIILVAGGIGASFTMPHLRDLVRRRKFAAGEKLPTQTSWLHSIHKSKKMVTRRVHFIWVVKSSQQIEWFRSGLNQLAVDMNDLVDEGEDVQVKIDIYITCDNIFTEDWSTIATKDTLHNKSLGDIRTADIASSSESLSSVGKQDVNIPSRASEQEIVTELNIPASTDPQNCNCKSEPASTIPCTCYDDQGAHCPSPPAKDTTINKWPHLHSSINLQTGRPKLYSIMQDVLEAAHGESAVVSCGPRSISDECRRTTVALSDERAVHKGTGAMGIWYWGEGYGYA